MQINWKGVDWGHIALGLAWAIIGTTITFLSSENWSGMIGPSGAVVVAGALQIAKELYGNLAPKAP